MSFSWSPEQAPPASEITSAGWARVALRGSAITVLLLAGVLVLVALRLAEWPFHGTNRPWSAVVPRLFSRAALALLGIRHQAVGRRMNRRGAVVANHASWLDIFALNARKRIYFVSKSEVATWPGIGFLARITGTVFIARARRDAKLQQRLFEERLLAGQKLLFFPEGTSTDGFRVLHFKSTLFQAFFNDTLRHEMHIQPVTVIYFAPPGADPRFYGWWGDMAFGPHLLRVLAAPPGGGVRVIYHDPVRVDDFTDRKALAAHVEDVVRGGMPPERRGAR